MPFCPECGKPVAAQQKFCRNCGASQAEEPPAPLPPQSPSLSTAAALKPAPAPAAPPVSPPPAPAPVSPPVPAAPPAPQPVPAPVQPGNVLTCRACGNVIRPGDKYCSKCLVSVKDTVAPKPPQVPVVPPVMPVPASSPAPAVVSSQPAGILTCRACGNVIRPGDRYCSKCLVMVQDTTPAAPAPVPAPQETAPVAQPPAPVATPAGSGEVRTCKACGNAIKPGDRYCSKCLVMVREDEPAAPAPVPVMAPAPAAPGTYACASCGSPLSGTEKFCGTCGGPAVAARAADPAPANPAGRICGSCGAPLSEQAKFCGSCGKPVGGI